MAKFKFRLQSFLGVKEKIEEQKKIEYGKALKKLEDEREKKNMLERQLALTLSDLRAEIEKGISPQKFISSKQFIVHLEKEIIKQDAEIDRAERFAESKRVELVAAMKQRKMVETLKEHDYEEYLVEESKEEQKILDEIVSYRFGNYEK